MSSTESLPRSSLSKTVSCLVHQGQASQSWSGRSLTVSAGASSLVTFFPQPTDPSELCRPVAVSKLLEDEYTRDIKGYLPDSNIAFLDELFRGSSAVLNSLLQVLNERTFNNGKNLYKRKSNQS